MSKTPSEILSDAFNRFHREATLAFTKAQDQATTEARQARRERDDAVNALHASRLEEQAWKQEAGVWKATADQAELTINHHLETIAQLRQQADQWKNQCLRLEETSRQEAISWKEQFLRVEQERSKLAQRVDELVVEQRSVAHAPTAPFTPRYSAVGDLSASTRLQRASALDSLSPRLQEHPPSKSGLSASKAPTSANRTRVPPVMQLPTPSSENQRSARQRITQEAAHAGPSSNGTRQVLIRRVQAVVEVPVKEESVDPEDVGAVIQTSTGTSIVAPTSTSASASISNVPPKATERAKATPRAKRKLAPKRSYVEVDDEESERDDDNYDSVPNHAREESVSDDDELLMGGETNRKDVYGMKRVTKHSLVQKTARPLNVVKQRKVAPPAKRSRPATASKA